VIGQIANPFAGGVINRIGNRRPRTGNANFTNPARSEEIDFGIRNIDRRNLDGANVSVEGT